MEKDSLLKLKSILEKYQLNNGSKEFLDLIEPIFYDENFQRRMTLEFAHHGSITLGEHILCDAAVTYKLFQKTKYKKAFYPDIAVIIAMFHDLYTLPWQNNPDNFQEFKYNAHGYRHPIEAIINAYTWFPDYFKDKEKAEIIIDGVIHHMFPFPVKAFDGSPMELKNQELFEKIPEYYKNLIINSTLRGQIGHFSICPSTYKEGRIMSSADKIVSISQFTDFNSIKAIFTGGNKDLDNYDKLMKFKKTK